MISADALELDEAASCRKASRIAANLPYNVGTALLIKWLTVRAWPPLWASLTLMFQKEVAQRIAAKPGSEHYGRLSVLAQWRCTAKILFDVNRSAFVPPPSVTSSIVRLEPRAEPLAPAQLTDLEKDHRRRLRPAPQDAAPVPESRWAAKRCWKKPASIPPRGPKI